MLSLSRTLLEHMEHIYIYMVNDSASMNFVSMKSVKHENFDLDL